MKRVILVLAMSLLITVMGCAQHAYVGEPLPSDQIAVIKPGPATINQGLFLENTGYMELQSIDKGLKNYCTMTRRTLEVLPGDYALRIFFRDQIIDLFSVCDGDLGHMGTITFKAEAGKVYILMSRKKDGIWRFWLKDYETDKIISKMTSHWNKGEIVSNEIPSEK